jgi:hypothetical protein
MTEAITQRINRGCLNGMGMSLQSLTSYAYRCLGGPFDWIHPFIIIGFHRLLSCFQRSLRARGHTAVPATPWGAYDPGTATWGIPQGAVLQKRAVHRHCCSPPGRQLSSVGCQATAAQQWAIVWVPSRVEDSPCGGVVGWRRCRRDWGSVRHRRNWRAACCRNAGRAMGWRGSLLPPPCRPPC